MAEGVKEYAEYLCDVLSPLGEVVYKRMFGGFVIRINGQKILLYAMDVLYVVEVDVEQQASLAALGSTQFSYQKKSRPEPVVIKNWWSVPEELLDNEPALVDFVAERLATAA